MFKSLFHEMRAFFGGKDFLRLIGTLIIVFDIAAIFILIQMARLHLHGFKYDFSVRTTIHGFFTNILPVFVGIGLIRFKKWAIALSICYGLAMIIGSIHAITEMIAINNFVGSFAMVIFILCVTVYSIILMSHWSSCS